jgi:hypothetical protein
VAFVIDDFFIVAYTSVQEVPALKEVPALDD